MTSTRFRTALVIACASLGVGCSGNPRGAEGAPPTPIGGMGGAGGTSRSGGSGGAPGATDGRPADSTGASRLSSDAAAATNDGGGQSKDIGESTPVEAGALDPGTEGDGNRIIGPGFKASPDTQMQAGVPQGKLISFTLASSKIFPKAPARVVQVYVPAQYVAGTPAAVMVVQDGQQFYDFPALLSTTLNNLINAKKVPPIVVVLPSNGGGDSVGSERGLEYDTVSGLYAEWADTELLPRAEMETKLQLPNQAVTFTHDPEGRGSIGGSSGGAASFSMAWWRPDLFRRVIAFSGTFVNQVPGNSPFPHGCWIYHDVDPYNAAAPNGLIVQHCEQANGETTGSGPGPCDTPLSKTTCEAVSGCSWNTKVNKPIRIWHESGTNDLGAGDPASSYRNFDLANQRMAAAFALRGYHYHYDRAMGASHVDAGAMRQVLPEALTWLWRGYQPGK